MQGATWMCFCHETVAVSEECAFHVITQLILAVWFCYGGDESQRRVFPIIATSSYAVITPDGSSGLAVTGYHVIGIGIVTARVYAALTGNERSTGHSFWDAAKSMTVPKGALQNRSTFRNNRGE